MTVLRKNGFVVAVITARFATWDRTVRDVVPFRKTMRRQDSCANPNTKTSCGSVACLKLQVDRVFRGQMVMAIVVSSCHLVAPYLVSGGKGADLSPGVSQWGSGYWHC